MTKRDGQKNRFLGLLIVGAVCEGLSRLEDSLRGRPRKAPASDFGPTNVDRILALLCIAALCALAALLT